MHIQACREFYKEGVFSAGGRGRQGLPQVKILLGLQLSTPHLPQPFRDRHIPVDGETGHHFAPCYLILEANDRYSRCASDRI